MNYKALNTECYSKLNCENAIDSREIVHIKSKDTHTRFMNTSEKRRNKEKGNSMQKNMMNEQNNAQKIGYKTKSIKTATLQIVMWLLAFMLSLSFVAINITDKNENGNNSVAAITSDTGATATGFAGGTGTSSNPYKISSAMELRYLCSQTTLWTSSKYFKLTDNIEYTTSTYTPIGSETEAFNGNFDGGEHTITFSQAINTSISISVYGLFAYSDGGSISNLGVNWQGGLTVESSSSSSFNKSGVGSIVGNLSNGIIENCYNTGEVHAIFSGSQFGVGGIVGISNNTTISKCYNIGNITASGGAAVAVGGIIGGKVNSSTISNCYNTGTITVEPDVLAYAGGIAGIGDIITNSYNIGAVSASGDMQAYAGGICGQNGTITNCFSIVGDANKIASTGSAYVGGIVADSGTVTNCYYDYSGTATKNDGSAGTVSSLGTQITNVTEFNKAMKTQSTYTNASTQVGTQTITWDESSPWNFDGVWMIKGDNFPTFGVSLDCLVEVSVLSTPDNLSAIMHIMDNSTNGIIGQYVLSPNMSISLVLNKNTSYSIIVSKPYYWQVVFGENANAVVSGAKYTFTTPNGGIDSTTHTISISGNPSSNFNNSIVI